MAKLVPANETTEILSQEQALLNVRDIRSRSRLAPGETIADLINEGRKY